MNKVIPVVLCGGAGTRLWPVSRDSFPKQFHPLVGERTLLQDTAIRLNGLPGLGAAMFLTNQEYRFLVAEQLRDAAAADTDILLEPHARNSAPAVACAALRALDIAGPDAILVVMPADHVIRDPDGFRGRVEEAIRVAAGGPLVTFGIVPDRAETGYGYIQAGAPMAGFDAVRDVRAFVEKPDAETAAEYIKSGDYLWNSGIFVFLAARYIEELESANPQMLSCCRDALAGAERDLDFLRLDAAAFERCPSDSIDYAVMEQAERIAVVPIDLGWDDIGAWDALAKHHAGADGNALIGDVNALDTRDSLLYSSGRLLTALGVDNLVVVETPDAVLVSDKRHAQRVKELVTELKTKQRTEATTHTRVYRPWGFYQSLDVGARHQVKRIGVHPGASLSLQLHHQRAEHWVVVTGTARVTLGDKEFDLQENESVYIPIGTRHRLANLSDDALEIIEVQTGGYLGEDDIVRFDDVYGRAAD